MVAVYGFRRSLIPPLQSRLPPDEKESLKMLSEFAQKHKITIVTLKADARTDFPDGKKLEDNFAGKTCFTIPVSIIMTGKYEDLVQYLQEIRTVLPAYAVIEKMEIHKDSTGIDQLNATLNLNLYLVS